MDNITKTLDMRGRPCPEPVIETRNALTDETVARFVVQLDNEAAAENVSRTARGLGCEVAVDATLEGVYTVVIARGEASPATASPGDDAPVRCGADKKVVVLFSRGTFGVGDPDLGRALLFAFAGTLKSITPRPTTLIFLNGGAELVCEETPFSDHVAALEKSGVSVLVCGTCLDFYKLDDKLRVGTVSNMMEIASILAAADTIIQP